MNNVVYIDKHIKLQLLSAEIKRANLERRFELLRNELYVLKKELYQIEYDIKYCKEQLSKIRALNDITGE